MSNNPYPATLLCDFYKISHREQYPEKTEYVYSTWTPRTSRMEGVDKVIAFGFQAFIKKYLINYFDKYFFSRPKADIVAEYTRVIKFALGIDAPYTKHIEKLHDLGYLPIKIMAVPEGTKVPIRVPMLTIENTHPDFFWLTNYLETLASCELWLGSTSATTAYEYRKLFDYYCELTGGDMGVIKFQGHDFSMRGMSTLDAAEISGAGHLLSFSGTDTIPAILHLENYYNANVETELVGTSIPATEHSVMCAYGAENEEDTYKRLITDVYPKGFISIVSDTWNFWEVLDKIIKPLKDTITARDGRVVIRPDSGDPVKIICGDSRSTDEFVRKGALQLLWEIFGGTINDKGYKVLDPHIGLIYGDAITLTRAGQILDRLEARGFCSTNIVFGIGSYTYNYITRDAFGFALKSTHVIIDGEEHNIFKDPITDPGSIKKSLIGRVQVFKCDNQIIAEDGYSSLTYEEPDNMLKTVFMDGVLLVDQNLKDIRARIRE